MISRQPKRWNLELEDRIWVYPDEDLRLLIPTAGPLEEDVVLSAKATEHDWPHGVPPLTHIEGRQWPADDEEPSVFDVRYDGLYINIPWAHIAYWGRGRRMRLAIYVTRGEHTWVFGHCDVTIAQGS